MSDQRTITQMFDDISSHYDPLNHLFSFGIDKSWRKRISKLVSKHHPIAILDVATGTADLAIRLATDNPQAQITGVDLSEKMLAIGKKKVVDRDLSDRIHLNISDATCLPYPDNSFDAVTVAFGVRNFSDLKAGLREMERVCRSSGQVFILEFSHPRNAMMRWAYCCYSKWVIPRLGRLVSKHPTAYQYLPSSAAAFPDGEEFLSHMKAAGLNSLKAKTLSGGIATLYYGTVQKKGQPS